MREPDPGEPEDSDGEAGPPSRRGDLRDDPVIQDCIRRLDLLNQARNLRLRMEADLERAREAQRRGAEEAMWFYLHRADRLIRTALRLQDEAIAGFVAPAEAPGPAEAEPILDAHYRYRGFLDLPAHCRLRVFEPREKPVVVIATELLDNPGTSITNFAGELATEVWALLEQPARGMLWIEHYPKRGPRPHERESFAQVSFTKSGAGFTRPQWRHLPRPQVEAWIEGRLEEERPGWKTKPAPQP